MTSPFTAVNFLKQASCVVEQGKHVLGQLLREQVNEIDEHLLLCEGVDRMDDPDRPSIVMNALERTCRDLETVAGRWKEVMSEKEWKTLVEALMGRMCEAVVGEVMKVKDVSENAGKALFKATGFVLSYPFSFDLRILEIEPWRRLSQLNAILHPQLTMVELEQSIREGGYYSFKPRELQRMVSLIWADNQKRENLLKTIPSLATRARRSKMSHH